MSKLPMFRQSGIVIQEAGNELLIYDLTVNKVYCLNETSKIIYEACDGKTTFDELKSKHKYSDEIIYLALDELKKNNFLQEIYVSPFAGMNRREVIRKAGLASMIVLPIITGLIAPSANRAASGATCSVFPGRPPCNIDSDCIIEPSCQFGNGCSCVSNCCVGNV